MNIINRKLGGLESLFYTWDQSDPKHFMLAAEVEGNTSIENWTIGLSLLQQRHPMLTVGISVDADNGLAFEPSGNRSISLEIIDYGTAFDIQIELEKELSERVDTSKGPLARVKIFQDAKTCVVILCVHHSVADGLSVVFLLNDLLKAVTGLDLEQLPVLSSMDDILDLNVPLLGARIPEQVRPQFLKKYENIRGSKNPRIELIDFSRELTEKLVMRTKQEGTTIHGTLQAAAIEALIYFSEEQRTEVSIMSPISPREYLGVTENCGLYTMASTVNFDMSEKRHFWDLSRHAKKELAASSSLDALKGYIDQTNQLVTNVGDLTGFMEANFKIDIMLSNLGRFPFSEDYGSMKITGMYGPMIISGLGNKQSIGAVTVNGRLSLSNSSLDLIPGLLGFIHQKLAEACGYASI